MSARIRHLGVNLVSLSPGQTGGLETYARELIPAIMRRSPDLAVTAFVNADAEPELRRSGWLEGAHIVKLALGSSRPAWVALDQLLVPTAARRYGVQVIHSVASTAPAFPGCPSVVTIHDLIYHHYPEAHGRLRALGMRALVPLAARRADRIITGSHATATDIEQLLKVSPEKIDVVWHGIGRTPDGKVTEEAELRRRYELGDAPLVLCVCAKRPHKNLARLIESFAILRADPRPTLVIGGYATPHEAELRNLVEERGLASRVRILGWVEGRDLEGLYAAATCFAFPSLAEGFGLPVLEAMQRGVPVACSDAGPLPEVAGNAAIAFDPLDVAQMAASIDRLLSDRELRSRLVEAGRRRAAGFSWDRAAEQTLTSYERVLASRAGGVE